MEFKTFSAQDLYQKVTMSSAIELMKQAFSLISSGDAIAPPRTVIESPENHGRALFMPSYSPGFSLFGLKMVSVFDHNSKLNLPIIQGQMLVMDATSGTPLAMIEAGSLTALRTGAASGLATDLLARKDATVLALFGTGAQARTQVEAILCVRKIREVLVFGSSLKQSEQFCAELQKFEKVPMRPAHPGDLKTADIICTATTSAAPLFSLAQPKPGVHINGIGSYKPAMREIPAEVIQTALVVVDQRGAALTEAGDIMLAIQQGVFSAERIHAELGEIVSGKRPGRENDNQITVFKSVGNALQDLAVANFLLKQ